MTDTNCWAMQADLTALVGGQEWAARRWSSETLAFYNRGAYSAWCARTERAADEQRHAQTIGDYEDWAREEANIYAAEMVGPNSLEYEACAERRLNELLAQRV